MRQAATLVQTVGKGKAMTREQVDKICIDWLKENNGEELATKYRSYPLVIPMWNTSGLNEALETLMQVLHIAFGPDESFGAVAYYEVRKKAQVVGRQDSNSGGFLKGFRRS